MTRPSWDEWAMGVAEAVARRGDCTRSQVGAVALDQDHIIIATGYNGSPPGDPGCKSDGACPRASSDVPPGSSYDTGPGACIALHAEQNLIMRSDWKTLVGATLYVTREPCGGCLKMINAARFGRVVWPRKNLILPWT